MTKLDELMVASTRLRELKQLHDRAASPCKGDRWVAILNPYHECDDGRVEIPASIIIPYLEKEIELIELTFKEHNIEP